MLKRYLLFLFWDYEAGGGWNDLEGDFDSIEDAMSFPRNGTFDQDAGHIVDMQQGKVTHGYRHGQWTQVDENTQEEA